MDGLKSVLPQLVEGDGKFFDSTPALIDSLIAHGLGPLAAHVGFEGQRLCDIRYREAASYLARIRVLEELDSYFSSAKVEAVLLKGASVAQRYWPEPSLRPSCDLDLLLAMKDKSKTNDLFSKLGYTLISETTSGQKWRAEGKGRPPLDVVFSMRAAQAINPTYQIKTESVFESCQKLEGFTALKVMDAFDLSIHCAVHAADHAFSRLIWLADLAFIISSKSSLLVDGKLFDMACQRKASRALRLALSLSFQLFLPERMDDVPRPPWGTKWLVRQIADRPSQWGDQFISPRVRTLLRACLVDRPRDLLRAAVGLIK